MSILMAGQEAVRAGGVLSTWVHGSSSQCPCTSDTKPMEVTSVHGPCPGGTHGPHGPLTLNVPVPVTLCGQLAAQSWSR